MLEIDSLIFQVPLYFIYGVFWCAETSDFLMYTYLSNIIMLPSSDDILDILPHFKTK